MRALVYAPGEPAVAVDVRDFKHIQELCGGYIERVILDYVRGSGRRIQLWCNENGLAQCLPANVWAEGPTYNGAPIFGTAVILASVDTMDDQVDAGLTDEEMERWSHLRRPGLRLKQAWVTIVDVRRSIEELMGSEATTEIAERVTRTLRDDGTINYDGRNFVADLTDVDLWEVADRSDG